ncbi:MAG: type II toxin-antitoxin system VapC family toxin [Pseudonocardiaceae bacterium]
MSHTFRKGGTHQSTAALVKLVHPEPDSAPLISWLAAARMPVVTSALAEVEVERAIRRNAPAALPAVPAVLSTVFLFDIDAAIRRAAARMADPLLRSLEAIHLATALEFGSGLHTFIAYDKRLLAAAFAAGLTVAHPTSTPH